MLNPNNFIKVLASKLISPYSKSRLRSFYLAGKPVIFWARLGIKNWGDDLNPWLFEKLTSKKAVYCKHGDVSRLLMAGSILHCSGPQDICWGTGLLSREWGQSIRLKHAFACRGPLSARVLEDNGINPPSIFGDPGILCADFVSPVTVKRASLGIIPHYADQAAGELLARELQAKLIPVSLGIEAFVKAVSEVDAVASSSLHGLICAESLGIPATWIKLSDNLVGGCFKFRDYVSGTGRESADLQPLDTRNTLINDQSIRINAWPDFDLLKYKINLIESFPLSNPVALP